MIWEEGQSMVKHRLVQLFVEGKSDEIFFEGSKFKEFTLTLGYTIKVKNLRTRGNVTNNFEKHLKASSRNFFANILVYDRDCRDFNSGKLDMITRQSNKTFACVAFEELEAWFLANHSEIKRIKSDAKLSNNTQSIANPKKELKDLFMNAGKGFKTEAGLAEYFCGKINFDEARKHNKSLHTFLNLFENNFTKTI